MGNAFWSFFKAYYEEIENSPSKIEDMNEDKVVKNPAFDPRSPTQYIDRTPIQLPGAMHQVHDPRSPSEGIERTPIIKQDIIVVESKGLCMAANEKNNGLNFDSSENYGPSEEGSYSLEDIENNSIGHEDKLENLLTDSDLPKDDETKDRNEEDSVFLQKGLEEKVLITDHKSRKICSNEESDLKSWLQLDSKTFSTRSKSLPSNCLQETSGNVSAFNNAFLSSVKEDSQDYIEGKSMASVLDSSVPFSTASGFTSTPLPNHQITPKKSLGYSPMKPNNENENACPKGISPKDFLLTPKTMSRKPLSLKNTPVMVQPSLLVRNMQIKKIRQNIRGEN